MICTANRYRLGIVAAMLAMVFSWVSSADVRTSAPTTVAAVSEQGTQGPPWGVPGEQELEGPPWG